MYRYNGKELDEATGLYDYGFRWYDPSIGRFTGVDPIADQFAFVSPYNYAENAPINNIDLWGLQKGGNLFDKLGDFIDKAAEAIGFSYGPAGTKGDKSPRSAEQASSQERMADIVHGPTEKVVSGIADAADFLGMTGADTELVGDIMAGGGFIVTVVGAPEVGLPMVAVGETVSTAGATMQAVAYTADGNYAEAGRKVVVESVPVLSVMPLKSAAARSGQDYLNAATTATQKKQTQHAQESLNQTIDAGGYMLEQILDKVTAPNNGGN